jgi:hypothetical protein
VRRPRLLVLLGAALVAGAAVVAFVVARGGGTESAPPTTQPLPPRADGIAVRDLGHAWLLENAEGRWTVEKRCRRGAGLTVGPGYVSRLVTRAGDVLVDDAREPGALNDPLYGGLGAFGWHHARGRPGRTRLGHANAWEVSGRRCARANGGFGVSAARVVRTPDARDPAPELVVDVFFSDAFTFPRPLMRVRYEYALRPASVDATVTVTTLCNGGRCGRTPAVAFVKEPKLVAHVTGGGLTHTVTFDASGEPVCRYDGAGPATGPILETGQCAANDRVRIRFAGPDECTSHPCLDVTARSRSGDWEQGGLDSWARRSGERPAAAPSDTGASDGVVWGCHGGDPAGSLQRRWEVAARRDADGRTIALGALFPAWEGGRGSYDCEPLARAFGPAGERFTVRLRYALVLSGSSNQKNPIVPGPA